MSAKAVRIVLGLLWILNGGVLKMRFNESKDELVISKPLSIDDLSSKLSNYIKPNTQPLVDIDAYYQANR